MSRMRALILRLVMVLIVIIATWRILTLGLAEYYVGRTLAGDLTSVDKALSWNSSHPKALYLKARQISSKNPDRAISLLQKAIRHNPTDGRAVAELALLLFDAGDITRGDILAEQAIRLMPSYVQVRLKVAEYWIKREQWKKTLRNWDAALITQPSISDRIFPVLLQTAEAPESRSLLLDMTVSPPPWWDKFYSYVVKHAKSTETVIALTSMRQASEVKLSVSERRDIVWRLKKDQMWPQAYLLWANGLSGKQQKYLGNIYNGNFEMEYTNEGFDWHIQKVNGVSVTFQHQIGAVDENALHLNFNNTEIRFRYLYQPLYLQTGVYEFLVKTKIDYLRGRGGLVWTVNCAGNNKELLGESERLLGAGAWKTIGFEFSVPEGEDCEGQILRLQSTGKHTYDHKLEGDIWFDQVIIRAVRQERNP